MEKNKGFLQFAAIILVFAAVLSTVGCLKNMTGADSVTTNSGIAEAEKITETETETEAESETEKVTETETVIETESETETTPPEIPDYISGFNEEFVKTLTEDERIEAEAMRDEEHFVFYRQSWSALAALEYGPDGFGQCGCGPTCIAEIISNLTGVAVTPAEMRIKALENGCVTAKGETMHSFMTNTAEEYGLTVEKIPLNDTDTMLKALREGKLVLVVMGCGRFTLGSHFMIFRGITSDGKILIADSYSYKYSRMEWDFEELSKELKRGYWIFSAE